MVQDIECLIQAQSGMAVILGTLIAAAMFTVVFDEEACAGTGFFKYFVLCILGIWKEKGGQKNILCAP